MKSINLLSVLFCTAVSLGSPVFAQTSTRHAVETLMRRTTPRLEYRTSMPADSFPVWQSGMSREMTRLMRHPDEMPARTPVKVAERRRDGYNIERWVSYPLEGAEVPFYVLVPDSLASPTAAALCIPGFGQTKELLAGERRGNYTLEGDPDPEAGKAAMAQHFVREGVIAVAVDNPSFGELSDNGNADYLTTSRFLLETGWSYLGLTSWQDRVILEWMKTDPRIRPDRIIASGFSLGTEPMMALGLMDPSIYAFVYNDFLCRTRERILVMNRPDDRGQRPFPNSIEHLIPGFLTQFDFPDIVAALAPRPVICTEGGLDRDFDIIADAFAKAGVPGNFERHHYARFADPASRATIPGDTLPSGIDRAEFFRLCNVDPPRHYFKTEHILPWLRRLLKEE